MYELKANIREEIHNVLQRVMDDFIKFLQECIIVEGDTYCILFSKSEQYMYHTLFSRFLLYANMPIYIIYSMKQNLFLNENSQSSLPDPIQ
jgi:hypothetical protein